MDFILVDQHFCGARARIVVRCHAHAIGARRKQGQQVAFLDRQITRKAKKIASLADRADDVVAPDWRCPLIDGDDVVIRLVECWPHQIIHCGIDDGEIPVFAWLQILDASEQQARVADQRTSRLQQQFFAASGKTSSQLAAVGGEVGRRFVAVTDTDAAAEVDVVQDNALGCQRVDQGQHTPGRIGQG